MVMAVTLLPSLAVVIDMVVPRRGKAGASSASD